MVTERELRDLLTEAADDPAAETYTLGLSDRALMAAKGRQIRRWTRFVPGIAVGTAFVVAGTFGVLALDGGIGGGSGSGGRSSALNAPAGAANAVAQGALADFEVECTDGNAPKMAMDWVWDPGSQQYRAVDSQQMMVFTPSPDGKRALVVQGLPAERWAVADWADAVAGRLTYHELGTGMGGVRWTADGTEVTRDAAWATTVAETRRPALAIDTADFYDAGTGGKHSVSIPAAVRDRVAGGQWVLQQWQGEHESVLFPLASVSGDRVEWLDAQGKVVRTLILQNGLAATSPKDTPALQVALSPDNRYLAEFNGADIATFDLRANGRRIALSPAAMDLPRSYYLGWTGDHQITLAVDPALAGAGTPGRVPPKTGHSPVYRVYGPDLKLIEEAKFVLPADPKGYCSSWPITWAPKTRFPGAFAP